uniref:Uncharacterized protein n=1 Tax=Oryza rufipogon TaxID=4529 RepID=A0A0E0P2U4_ORYRU
MAVRPGWAVAVARASAAAWQRVACNPETLPADQVLGLLCCAPLHLLARLAAFLCIPFVPVQAMPRLLSPRLQGHPRRLLLLPPQEFVEVEPMYSPFPSSSSSSSDDDDDSDIEDGEIPVHGGTRAPPAGIQCCDRRSRRACEREREAKSSRVRSHHVRWDPLVSGWGGGTSAGCSHVPGRGWGVGPRHSGQVGGGPREWPE